MAAGSVTNADLFQKMPILLRSRITSSFSVPLLQAGNFAISLISLQSTKPKECFLHWIWKATAQKKERFIYQAKTLIYGIKQNVTLFNMAFPHILPKCHMPNPAHPAKMSHVKSPNTMPKCHMPKLQHHVKMSQNEAAGLEQIAPAGRFFLFTEVSRFRNPLQPHGPSAYSQPK